MRIYLPKKFSPEKDLQNPEESRQKRRKYLRGDKDCIKGRDSRRRDIDKTIEIHCPPEWKCKTKPKNEKTSFSKQVEEKPQQQIAADAPVP